MLHVTQHYHADSRIVVMSRYSTYATHLYETEVEGSNADSVLIVRYEDASWSICRIKIVVVEPGAVQP